MAEEMERNATAGAAAVARRPGNDELVINTIRFLAVDMVEKANSGHPGAPMGLAPLAYLLWTRHLRCAPQDPPWPNRPRFLHQRRPPGRGVARRQPATRAGPARALPPLPAAGPAPHPA